MSNYLMCFVMLVLCVHSILVLHPKTVLQHSTLHGLEDMLFSQPNTNMTSFLDTILLSQTATAKANAVWLVIIQSSLSIPPTVSSHQLCTLVQVLHIRTLVAIEIKLENCIIFKKHITSCVSSFLMCLDIALKTHLIRSLSISTIPLACR